MSAASRARAAAMLVPIVLASCLAGKRISDIDAPGRPARPATGPPWSVPPGVAVTAAQRGLPVVRGLYPATTASERCCWIAPHATVGTRVTTWPAELRLDVLVPSYPFFEERPQALTVSVAGTAHRFSDLGPGVHRLRFDVTPAPNLRHDGIATIELTTERTFVPKAEHVNADVRALGIILLRVSLQPADASD